MDDIPQPTRDAIAGLPSPELAGAPWVKGKPLKESRIALLTSAALHPKSELPFAHGSAEFRILPAALPASELAMSHVSINFDRYGFQRDVNVAYPIDRLRELSLEGAIGSVAPSQYSVMGSTDPATMAATADGIAVRLKQESVDAVLLCPV